MIHEPDRRDRRNNGVALYIMERPDPAAPGRWRCVGDTGRPGFRHEPPRSTDYPDGYAVPVPLFPEGMFDDGQ